MNLKLIRLFAPAVCALPGLCSCNGSAEHGSYSDFETADTLTHHARYLTIADCGSGVTRVDIADPTAEGKWLGRYAFVHRDSAVPDDLDRNIAVVRVPVNRAAVFSSVYTDALRDLDAISSVVAVADASYFGPTDTITSMLTAGTVADLGSSQAPSTEKLAASQAEVVLRSPMQGVATATLPLGVTAIECADYLENSPIGRAEWILLLGELAGCREQATKIFTEVIDNYSDLCFKASGATSPRPKVLVESEYSGVWYVPAGGSYMARMLADAGGVYPWADTEGTGSLALGLENVAEKAIDADVWLMRQFGYTPDAASLIAQNKRYASFKPVKTGEVYGCDSAEKPIFNDTAFHPDRVLAEYVAIFHPDVMPGYKLRYFVKSK